MPILALPIDFDAIRVAVVAAIRMATGLSANGVIMAEPEAPDAPRPPLPYVTIKLLTVSAPNGWAYSEIDAEGNYASGAQRSLVVSVNTYGGSHEAAYNLIATIQAGFDMMPIRDSLRAAGLAVWTIGTASDLSALLDTGYEGRAQMDVTMGVASNATISNVDTIEVVPVTVQPSGADRSVVAVQLGDTDASN